MYSHEALKAYPRSELHHLHRFHETPSFAVLPQKTRIRHSGHGNECKPLSSYLQV